MGIVIAVIFIVAFVALLVFLPADKLLKNINSSNNRCCKKNRINDDYQQWHKRNTEQFDDYLRRHRHDY